MGGRAYPFQSTCGNIVQLLVVLAVPVVALRVELSATWLSARYGQPALDYQCSQVGKVGLEPTISCSQNTRASRCPTSRLSVRTAGFEPAISWPPTRRDTRLRYVLELSAARVGVEPNLLGLKDRASPEVERAVLCAYAQRGVDQGALESPSPGFQTRRYAVSATGPSSCVGTKKARCRFDTGLWWFPGVGGQVSQAQRMPGQRIRRMDENGSRASLPSLSPIDAQNRQKVHGFLLQSRR